MRLRTFAHLFHISHTKMLRSDNSRTHSNFESSPLMNQSSQLSTCWCLLRPSAFPFVSWYQVSSNDAVLSECWEYSSFWPLIRWEATPQGPGLLNWSPSCRSWLTWWPDSGTGSPSSLKPGCTFAVQDDWLKRAAGNCLSPCVTWRSPKP